MNNSLLKFKTLMAYFKPIGSVGFNVDMDNKNVEFFDNIAYTQNGKPIKMLGSIENYITELINKNGEELYELTNRQDYAYVVDVTVKPKENKIILKPKYWELNYIDDSFDFGWQKDFPGSEVELIYNIFESDQTIDRIIVDWRAHQEYLHINEITLDKDTHYTTLYLDNEQSFKSFLRQVILKVSNNDIWDQYEGSEGTLVFKRYGDGLLYFKFYNKTLKIGQPIVIDENYFDTGNLNENKTDMDKEDNNDEIFKNYIDIKEIPDSNPKNLNLDDIQKNTRFAKLLNTLLYELYSDNLGMNDDESKYGIVNIYPLNEFTSWSILNYFGGHKFVKRILLEQFNRTKNEKTPKEFYRWLIENKETLLKTGPLVKELIRTNFNTYNKGSITEKYVIDKLKGLSYVVKYFPPGSKKDREGGVDIEVNGISYQIKELTGMEEVDGKIYIKTPLPKNYLGLEVKKIMLVDIKTGEFVSFPNKGYKLDLEKGAFVLDVKDRGTIKTGNLNRI
jgi:hypothetical protein